MTAAPPASTLERYRAEFPIFRHTRYLNSCSLGALSTRTREAMLEYLEVWERRGAAAWYDTWLPAVTAVRWQVVKRPLVEVLRTRTSQTVEVVGGSGSDPTRTECLAGGTMYRDCDYPLG